MPGSNRQALNFSFFTSCNSISEAVINPLPGSYQTPATVALWTMTFEDRCACSGQVTEAIACKLYCIIIGAIGANKTNYFQSRYNRPPVPGKVKILKQQLTATTLSISYNLLQIVPRQVLLSLLVKVECSRIVESVDSNSCRIDDDTRVKDHSSG